MLNTRAFATLLPLLLLAPALQAQATLSKPVTRTLPGGVVQVSNAGPSAWRDTTGWKLILETTIQPPDGTPGELANPGTVLRTSHGEYIVGDPVSPSINLYTGAGKFVRAIGRSGAGPGEYRQPFIAVVHDTLVIQDPRNSQIEVLTLDGKEVRTFSEKNTSCCYPLEVDGKGRLRIPQFRGTYTIWELADWRVGKIVDSIRLLEAAAPSTWKYTVKGGSGSTSIPMGSRNDYALLRDGSVLAGNTASYQFLVSRNGKDTVRMFGRSGVSPRPIPERIRDSVFHAVTDKNPPVAAIAKVSDMPKSYGLWSAFLEDGVGNIWVSADGQSTESFRFDVFSPAGAFLGSVPAPFQRTATITPLGDRLAVVDTDANDLPRVRIYRIVKGR